MTTSTENLQSLLGRLALAREFLLGARPELGPSESCKQHAALMDDVSAVLAKLATPAAPPPPPLPPLPPPPHPLSIWGDSARENPSAYWRSLPEANLLPHLADFIDVGAHYLSNDAMRMLHRAHALLQDGVAYANEARAEADRADEVARVRGGRFGDYLRAQDAAKASRVALELAEARMSLLFMRQRAAELVSQHQPLASLGVNDHCRDVVEAAFAYAFDGKSSPSWSKASAFAKSTAPKGEAHDPF